MPFGREMMLSRQHGRWCRRFSIRTTVTIGPDTEALLREEIRRTGLSFEEVLVGFVRTTIMLRMPPKNLCRKVRAIYTQFR